MRSCAVLGLLVVASFLLSCASGPPDRTDTATSDAVAAPEPQVGALCKLCAKPIPAGKEVFLVTKNAAPEPYRCVHCALTAQAAAPPPSVIRVRSPLTDTEITIRRDAEGWSVTPPTAVFLSLPEADGECMDRHRAFPDRDEYQRYLAAHPELPSADAVPYTIDRPSRWPPGLRLVGSDPTHRFSSSSSAC